MEYESFADVFITVGIMAIYGTAVLPRIIHRHPGNKTLAIQFVSFTLAEFLIMLSFGYALYTAVLLSTLLACGATLSGLIAYRHAVQHGSRL